MAGIVATMKPVTTTTNNNNNNLWSPSNNPKEPEIGIAEIRDPRKKNQTVQTTAVPRSSTIIRRILKNSGASLSLRLLL